MAERVDLWLEGSSRVYNLSLYLVGVSKKLGAFQPPTPDNSSNTFHNSDVDSFPFFLQLIFDNSTTVRHVDLKMTVNPTGVRSPRVRGDYKLVLTAVSWAGAQTEGTRNIGACARRTRSLISGDIWRRFLSLSLSSWWAVNRHAPQNDCVIYQQRKHDTWHV